MNGTPRRPAPLTRGTRIGVTLLLIFFVVLGAGIWFVQTRQAVPFLVQTIVRVIATVASIGGIVDCVKILRGRAT